MMENYRGNVINRIIIYKTHAFRKITVIDN